VRPQAAGRIDEMRILFTALVLLAGIQAASASTICNSFGDTTICTDTSGDAGTTVCTRYGDTTVCN
jgi:hypothetical protein